MPALLEYRRGQVVTIDGGVTGVQGGDVMTQQSDGVACSQSATISAHHCATRGASRVPSPGDACKVQGHRCRDRHGQADGQISSRRYADAACRVVAVNERGQRIGQDHPHAQLTDAEVNILLGKEDGWGYRRLARKFEISRRAVVGSAAGSTAASAARHKTLPQ